MKAQFVQTPQEYHSDYEAMRQLGTAMLGCNAMIVFDIAPTVALLFKTYPRPILTNHESAEVSYAGGLGAHVSGVPKTSYDGAFTCIETETGAIADLAELLVANNGCSKAILYDGRPNRWTKAHELIDCSLTFEANEIDAENRSSIVTTSGNMKYMYFGQNSGSGTVDASVFGGSQILTGSGGSNATDFLQRAQDVLNVVKAGNSLFQVAKNIF